MVVPPFKNEVKFVVLKETRKLEEEERRGVGRDCHASLGRMLIYFPPPPLLPLPVPPIALEAFFPLRLLLPSPLPLRPLLPKPAPRGRPELPLRRFVLVPLRLLALLCRPKGLRGVPPVPAPPVPGAPPLAPPVPVPPVPDAPLPTPPLVLLLVVLLLLPLPLRLEGPFMDREEEEATAVLVPLLEAAALAEESTIVACGLRGGAGLRGLDKEFTPLPPPLPVPPPLLVPPLLLLLLLPMLPLVLLPDFSLGRCTLSVRERGLLCDEWWWLFVVLLLLLLLLKLPSRLLLLLSETTSKFEAGASVASSFSSSAASASAAAPAPAPADVVAFLGVPPRGVAVFAGGIVVGAEPPVPSLAAAAAFNTGGLSSTGNVSFGSPGSLLVAAAAADAVLADSTAGFASISISDAGPVVTSLGALSPVITPSAWNSSLEDEANGGAPLEPSGLLKEAPPSGVLQKEACRELGLLLW